KALARICAGGQGADRRYSEIELVKQPYKNVSFGVAPLPCDQRRSIEQARRPPRQSSIPGTGEDSRFRHMISSDPRVRFMRSQSLFLLLPALGLLNAQDHGNGLTNPYKTPQDLAAGSKLFRAACAACHGLEGGGGSNGPSLTTGVFKHGGTDEALHRTISSGIPGTPMSAFPLKDQEVWQLVAHIQELNLRKGAMKASGDRVHGAQVFAESGCVKCHTADSPGGF